MHTAFHPSRWKIHYRSAISYWLTNLPTAFTYRDAYHLRRPHFFHLLFPLFRSVHRGDVVVFEFPGSKNEVKPAESVNYIKRCIGLPGDTIEIRFGKVFVNGIETSFPIHGKNTIHSTDNVFYRNAEMFPEGSAFSDVNYGPVVVPKQNDILKIDPATFSQWRIFIEREGHTVQFNADTILIDGAVIF